MPYLPFRIEFSQRAIDDLHRRIDNTRWPSVAFATGWAEGANDHVLRDLVGYWRRDFDWFAVQERLNRFAHLRGPIGASEELHCVVLAGGGEGRMPLLMLHGWPGSFIELLPTAELLAEGAGGGSGFDVVVPSLPGFGFSDAPAAPGMHPGRVGERMHELMRELGYERYAVHGGDWGAIVGSRMALDHPGSVIALHLTLALQVPSPPDAEIDPEERAWAERAAAWAREESGYLRLQGTKPQTLAYALNDSPVGLLAWILEKFWSWSDHGENLWETFSRDDVLANITLYWLTGTALSASRLYYELRHEQPRFRPRRVEVPTAFARFPGEPWAPPRAAVERAYRLERWTEPPRGGHFAALEQPELLAADVAEFLAAYA